MIDVFEPTMIPLTAEGSLALSLQLRDIKEQIITVKLNDTTVSMAAKWLSVNIFIWRPLVRLGLPVESRHTMTSGLVTKQRLAELQTIIYKDVIAKAIAEFGMVPAGVDRAILEDLCEIINDSHTMIASQLGEYHLSMSAFELCDLLLSPEIAPLTKIDITKSMQVGIIETENLIKDAGASNSLLMTRLRDRSIPNNVIAPFLELGQLNEKQLAQVVLAIGFRTDASENMVRLPITASYIEGLPDIQAYAAESLMAKKTVYYNKNAMPDSQYNSRKQQLLSSVIRHLYPGDCGATATVPFYIHQGNAKNVLDKNIVVDNKLICLDANNIKNYIGTTVQFRSPGTCRHTDGICHACGGRLTDFMPPHVSLGIASTVEYMANTAQLVLSAKHFGFTRAIAYVIPDQMKDYLVVKQNDIYVRENININRFGLTVQFRDINHIKELISDSEGDGSPIVEQQFSSVHFLTCFDAETGSLLTPETPMISGNTVPYFSTEVLEFLGENPKNVTIVEDQVYISFKNFDHVSKPLFRYVMQSNSMLKFVAALAKFTTSTIRDYTSFPEALAVFSHMVFGEVKSVNILHLEIVLKSYLITSNDDYNIPIVEDVNNVRFGTLLSIIPRRSLGAWFAFERLAEFMTKEPELYLFGHRRGDFDAFFIAE